MAEWISLMGRQARFKNVLFVICFRLRKIEDGVGTGSHLSTKS